jgi:hypothetical protein
MVGGDAGEVDDDGFESLDDDGYAGGGGSSDDACWCDWG